MSMLENTPANMPTTAVVARLILEHERTFKDVAPEACIILMSCKIKGQLFSEAYNQPFCCHLDVNYVTGQYKFFEYEFLSIRELPEDRIVLIQKPNYGE